MPTLSWVPVPSGVVALPAAPAVVDNTPSRWRGFVETVGGDPQATLTAAAPSPLNGDGVQDTSTWNVWKYNGTVWVNIGDDVGPKMTVSTLIPLFDERALLNAGTTTGVAVQSLPYAMALQTAMSLVTKTRLQAQKVVLITAPLTTVSVAANAPDVAIGAAVQVPVSTIVMAAVAPAVSVSTVVAVPLTSMALAAFAPTQAGADDTVISVPLSTVTLSALTPEGVGADLETFYNSWRLQVYGTDAWVYPDWWAD